MPNDKIAALWRFPVKSMKGEPLDRAELTAEGLVGDRAFALIDTESGKVASAKSVRHFPDLLSWRAEFAEPPRASDELPAVRITLADGTSVMSDAGDVDQVLSSHFKRDVRLARAAPKDFTIDQYHPDVADVDPRGHRDTTVEQKLGSAFFAEVGLPSPVPESAFFDLFPVTVLTSSTLDELRRLAPASEIDPRRFRMNVIVDTDASGFVENDWLEKAVAIGDVRLRVTLPDPRCVMTTLAQEDLPNDADVLRTLAKHNRLPIADAGQFPCAGVYAVVEAAGSIRVGQGVQIQ